MKLDEKLTNLNESTRLTFIHGLNMMYSVYKYTQDLNIKKVKEEFIMLFIDNAKSLA